MTSPLHSIEGQCPHGADLLREQLRWTNAERRWHPLHQGASDGRLLPPAFPPPGHASLLRGAVLTRLTMARAAGATAFKEQ
ncbi:hypothetical protein [Azospirillum sp. Sh1]|uniref:hypothetical protein n=1 Tax=Azospirillum sp. Sh1 TaxID=2607285 RepID=UPI0011ED3307|nr:hypothetical protein [Azospirillum sp. Sh1]KAA0571905.1 hypothetical protein FZ029_25010 [Azospirillum sp. Sh1]